MVIRKSSYLLDSGKICKHEPINFSNNLKRGIYQLAFSLLFLQEMYKLHDLILIFNFTIFLAIVISGFREIGHVISRRKIEKLQTHKKKTYLRNYI